MAGCRSLEMERVAVMGQARLSRCSELQNDKSPARLLFRYAILCLNSFIASLRIVLISTTIQNVVSNYRQPSRMEDGLLLLYFVSS